MKFFLSCSIICALGLSANPVLAINYQSSFNEYSQNSEVNSSQLSAAKLLQDYVESYKNKINQLHIQYEGGNNVAITYFNSQVDEMSINLDQIQKNTYGPSEAAKIMSQIVSDLKDINIRMKVFLEQEKIIYKVKIKEKQKSLGKIGLKISNTLDNLLLSVSNQLIKKNNLSNKEKRLVESLVVLREQNNKMKMFTQINFESEGEMNQYLKDVISSIRGEFQKIRSL